MISAIQNWVGKKNIFHSVIQGPSYCIFQSTTESYSNGNKEVDIFTWFTSADNFHMYTCSLCLAETVVFFSYASCVFGLSTKWRLTCLSGASTVRLTDWTSPTVGSGLISNNLINWNEKMQSKSTIYKCNTTVWHKIKNKSVCFSYPCQSQMHL